MIAFRVVVLVGIGRGGTVLEVGELLDPSRERAPTTRALVVVARKNCLGHCHVCVPSGRYRIQQLVRRGQGQCSGDKCWLDIRLCLTVGDKDRGEEEGDRR